MPGMIVMQLIFLGYLCGALSIVLWQVKAIRITLKKAWPFHRVILWCSFAILLGCLIKENWTLLAHPDTKKLNDFEQVKSMLLHNPANIKLITFGVFFALAGLFSFIVRFPFMKWEQLKLWGFEGKRAVDEAKSTAKEEMEREVKLSKLRMTYVEYITSENFYQDVITKINGGGSIDSLEIIYLFLNIYSNSFFSTMKIPIEIGAIPVKRNELVTRYYESLQSTVKECIYYSYIRQQDSNHFDGLRHTQVCKLHLPGMKDYILIYLTSTSYEFGDSDLLIIRTIEHVIEMFIERGKFKVVDIAS